MTKRRDPPIGRGPKPDKLMRDGGVNNSARQNMADIRTFANDLIWFQYGIGSKSVAHAYASATATTIAGADVTSVYHAGRRIKVVGSSTGTIYGTIKSSSYASSTTTVNYQWDSGSLANETLTVYLSQVPVTGSPVSPAAVPLLQGRNALINGAFQVAQRFTSSTAVSDDAYALDRWYILTQTASVNVSQGTDPEDGYTHYMRLSQNQASAQRMGFAQIIEGKNCKWMRGGSGTLSARIRYSNAAAVRYAILGWTGTEDSVTSDVVNSWTNGTFSAGQFFNSTNLSVLACAAVTPGANAWTSLTALTASLGSSFNNIIVMIWTEGTAAQNSTLDVDAAQFEAGGITTLFERISAQDNLLNCMRYTLKMNTPPMTGFFNANNGYHSYGYSGLLPAPMRASPSVTYGGNMPLYNSENTSVTAGVLNASRTTPFGLQLDFGGRSGGSNNLPGAIYADNNSSNYILLDAEL